MNVETASIHLKVSVFNKMRHLKRFTIIHIDKFHLKPSTK